MDEKPIENKSNETPGVAPEGSDTPVEEKDSQTENDGVSSAGNDELSRLAIAKALGLNKIGELKHYQDQVGRLLEWASLKGATDITSIVAQINELRNSVGPSKSIYNLSVLAGLELEAARLDKQIKQLKGVKNAIR